MLKLLAAATVALVSLTGCNPTCREACENLAVVCAKNFADSSTDFSPDACTKTCEDNLDGCKNMLEQRICAADSKSCDEFRACPGCSR